MVVLEVVVVEVVINIFYLRDINDFCFSDKRSKSWSTNSARSSLLWWMILISIILDLNLTKMVEVVVVVVIIIEVEVVEVKINADKTEWKLSKRALYYIIISTVIKLSMYSSSTSNENKHLI